MTAFRKLLVPALHVAERHDGFLVVREFLDQRGEMLLRLVGAVERVEIGGHLDRGVAVERRRRRDALVGLDGELGLLQRLVEIGERQERQRMIGREGKRELEIDETEILAAAPSKRRAKPVQRLRGAALRIVDEGR